MFKWNPFAIGSEAPNEVRYVSFGRSKSKSRPVQLPAWSPEQQATEKALGTIIQRGLTEPVPAYPGRLYVPRTPEEEAYLGRVPAVAEQIAEARARLGRPAYEITPETTEQFYEQAIRAPALREWSEIVEPTIREAYAGPGYWSSARAQAQQRGAEELAVELARQRATLAYQDELSRRQALEQAAAREAQFAVPYATAETGMLGTAGQYARMIEQEKALADLQRWLMGETVEGVTPYQYSPFLELAFSYLGLSPYVYGQKETSKGMQFGIMS